MAKKLSKKELFKLIKEAVAKKVNLLREDIDMDDEEIWDYYDDNLYNDWQNNYSKMPKGYDDDVTDLDTLDRMGRMNSDINGSPALKRAQIKASWAASDREDISNANKLSNQYEDNYYNDSNANTDPDASAWYSDSYNKNLKLGLKDWNKNGPNENKRYDGHKKAQLHRIIKESVKRVLSETRFGKEQPVFGDTINRKSAYLINGHGRMVAVIDNLKFVGNAIIGRNRATDENLTFYLNGVFGHSVDGSTLPSTRKTKDGLYITHLDMGGDYEYYELLIDDYLLTPESAAEWDYYDPRNRRDIYYDDDINKFY